MKKLLFAVISLLGLVAKVDAAPLYGYVQITTTTALTPTLQNGSIKIASGTIQNLNLTYGVSAATGSFSGTVTAGTFSGSGASLTGVILNQNTLQTNATFFVSSGTVQNFTATASTSTNLTFSTANGSNATVTTSTITTLTAPTIGGVTTLTASNGTMTGWSNITVTTITPTGIVGTTTNNNANTGNYGEYLSSTTAAGNAPTSGQFGDCGSVTPTAGDWDLSLNIFFNTASATVTGTITGGIGTATGNSSAGLADGDSDCYMDPNTTTTLASCTVPPVRKSISGSTQYFGKVKATYTSGPPAFTCRISARRMR